MSKYLQFLVAPVLVLTACNRSVTRIDTRPLPSPNPTTYTFSLPLEQVRVRALEAFSLDRQAPFPIFNRATNTDRLESIFEVECSTNPVFGAAIFSNSANTNDIYLHTFHMPFELSPVYQSRGIGLPFIESFQLHITENGSNTVVAVIPSDSQVINGTKFGFGPCGPGQGNVYVDVLPTTIEEYTVIRYLGDYLGISNMPPVALPKDN